MVTENAETYSVNLIHALFALVSFTFYPISVEVSEEAVEIISAGGVSIPFGCVIS
jgi:hypothetical protein